MLEPDEVHRRPRCGWARAGFVALVAAVLLVGAAPACSMLDPSSGDDRSERAPAGDRGAPTRTGTSGSLPSPAATAEVTLERDVVRRHGGRLEDGEASLVIEPLNGSALLAFADPALSAECLTGATLRVRTSSPVNLKVKAWVSLETDLASLPDDGGLGQYVIAPESPSVDARRDTGALTWEVGDLLRWSRGNQDPQGSFVVVLKPDFRGYAAPPILLAASESGRPPVLEVVTDPTCS